MNPEEVKLKSRDLVIKLINKISKCNWEKSFTHASNAFVLKFNSGKVYIEKKIILVYDSNDDLVLRHEPTSEENDAYNLAILWGKVYESISGAVSETIEAMIKEIDGMK